jgi:glucose dehydrogenase
MLPLANVLRLEVDPSRRINRAIYATPDRVEH